MRAGADAIGFGEPEAGLEAPARRRRRRRPGRGSGSSRPAPAPQRAANSAATSTTTQSIAWIRRIGAVAGRCERRGAAGLGKAKPGAASLAGVSRRRVGAIGHRRPLRGAPCPERCAGRTGKMTRPSSAMRLASSASGSASASATDCARSDCSKSAPASCKAAAT